MNEKQRKNEKTVSSRAWSSALIFMVVVLSFSITMDFVKDIKTNKNDYEIRYESSEEVNEDSDKKDLVDIATQNEPKDTDKQHKLYRLYRNDTYCKDIDINNYSYVDNNGKTDYKYCALTEDVNAHTSTLLLTAMMILVILIAKDSADKTPFTQTNVKRIKAISILQLLFAVLPGMISFTMTMVRFSNSHGSFNIKWMYLLIISAITALIANVFQYGVKLQEDSDSIA